MEEKIYICRAKSQEMEGNLYQIENISLALIFAVLGFFTTFLYIPKKEDYKYYRYSRYTLGAAFFVMTVYCSLNSLPINLDTFTAFSFQMLFYLIFSWLTYASFLYIIYTEKYKRKHFFLDGAIPISVMFVLATVGIRHPHLQEINSIIFGVVFSLKCIWMAYTCYKEYRKCTRELDNYFDVTPDIGWMKSVLVISYLLSIFTIVHFYVHETHIIYYPLLLICYIFLTLKIVNYIPEKISKLRHDSVDAEAELEQEKKKPAQNLKDKLEKPLSKWVEEKRFIQPNLTIKDVASAIGTNHNYLSKYLNSDIGMTFTMWLHSLRIEESKAMLTQSERMPIEEIGRRVGIMEIYNFSRWFKTITGVSPQQFRKQNK